VSAKFTFIDLCAGIGGLRIPFDGDLRSYEFMGKKIETLGGKCVFTAEIDKAARETYAHYFYRSKDAELIESLNNDLTNLKREVPEHDLLLAGFPCQPFSHAGKRNGFNDDRGNIFEKILGIIATKAPKVVLLENVRGLKTLRNLDGTSAIERIVNELRNPKPGLHYYVPEPKILNARDFGLAQNRQRLFIVAIRSDVAKLKGLEGANEFVWPSPTSDPNQLLVKDFLDNEVPQEFTISDRLWIGHKERKARNKSNGKGWGYRLFEPEDKYVATISARYFKDGSEALIDQGTVNNPRKLTPNEARKLQGFPDGFAIHHSKMQAFRQFGNAVPVTVIRALAESLKPYLL